MKNTGPMTNVFDNRDQNSDYHQNISYLEESQGADENIEQFVLEHNLGYMIKDND